MHNHAPPCTRPHGFAQAQRRPCNQAQPWSRMHSHAQPRAGMHTDGQPRTRMHDRTQPHSTVPKAAQLCTTTKQDSQPWTARRRTCERAPSPAPRCTRAHKRTQGRWGSTEAAHPALPCGFSTPRQEAAPKEAERGASKLRQGCARGSALHFLPLEQSRRGGGGAMGRRR